MAARIRTRTGVLSTGSVTRSDIGLVATSSYQPLSERCEDVIGNRVGDNPLLITGATTRESTLNGSYKTGGVTFTFVNHKCDYNLPVNHQTLPAIDSYPVSITKALSRANPSKSFLDIPVFVYELKDIPKLIKSTGEILLDKKTPELVSNILELTKGERPAEIYLNWEFGWKPLISDLLKLVEFQDKLERRVKDLKKLRSGLLTRSVTLSDDSVAANAAVAVNSSWSMGVQGRLHSVTRRKRWATVHWRPDPALEALPHDEESMINLARDTILGLRHTPKSLWEAMPWSWFVDYFTNVGDYIQANNNTVGAYADDLCIMTKTTSTFSLAITVQDIVPATKGSKELKRLERVFDNQLNTQVRATLPLFEGRQLSILTALAITRMG